MVPARVAGGAIVREGVELDSPLVATCPPGTALTITGEGTAANGTARLRVSQPVSGWVSTKSVDFFAPPPTPTLKAAPSTPRFISLFSLWEKRCSCSRFYAAARPGLPAPLDVGPLPSARTHVMMCGGARLWVSALAKARPEAKFGQPPGRVF